MGTFGVYSTIWPVYALPDDGEMLTLEVNQNPYKSKSCQEGHNIDKLLHWKACLTSARVGPNHLTLFSQTQTNPAILVTLTGQLSCHILVL